MKAKQPFVEFTCRNFGPCGAQVEKDREGIKITGEKNFNLGPSALTFLPFSRIITIIRSWSRETKIVGIYYHD